MKLIVVVVWVGRFQASTRLFVFSATSWRKLSHLVE